MTNIEMRSNNKGIRGFDRLRTLRIGSEDHKQQEKGIVELHGWMMMGGSKKKKKLRNPARSSK
jgi:hypothetical protein